jgi:hypothetical protein
MCIPVFCSFLDGKEHHKSVRKLIGVRFAKYNKVFFTDFTLQVEKQLG